MDDSTCGATPGLMQRCILQTDVRTEQLFAKTNGVFRMKPLKVKLLAGEQKATEVALGCGGQQIG